MKYFTENWKTMMTKQKNCPISVIKEFWPQWYAVRYLLGWQILLNLELHSKSSHRELFFFLVETQPYLGNNLLHESHYAVSSMKARNLELAGGRGGDRAETISKLSPGGWERDTRICSEQRERPPQATEVLDAAELESAQRGEVT